MNKIAITKEFPKMDNQFKTMRELMVEYILFCNDDDELIEKYMITPSEIPDLPDEDLLEIYDQTLLDDLVGGIIDDIGETGD